MEKIEFLNNNSFYLLRQFTLSELLDKKKPRENHFLSSFEENLKRLVVP